jgi:hypothetical protein
MRTIILLFSIIALASCFKIARKPDQLPSIAETRIEVCSVDDIEATYERLMRMAKQCLEKRRSTTGYAAITTTTTFTIFGERSENGRSARIFQERHSPGETSFNVMVDLSRPPVDGAQCKSIATIYHRWSTEEFVAEAQMIRGWVDGTSSTCTSDGGG